MQFLWKWIDELVGKGLDWTIIAELMAYAAITLIPTALPLAILISSIMTFGNMGENYELTALKSAGISLSRIMAPLVALTILISVGAFYFSNNVMPYTFLKMSTLLIDIRQEQPELSIKEGVFFNDIKGFSFKVGKKDPETGLLNDVMVYDHSELKGNVQVTIADSGYMKITPDKGHLMLDLYNGYTYSEVLDQKNKKSKSNYPLRRDKFEHEKLMFKLDNDEMKRSDEGSFKKHYQMLSLRQLNEAVDSLEITFDSRTKMFSNNLLRTSYFKKENKPTENDSTISIAQKINHYVSVDSVLSTMDLNKKTQLKDVAFNYARSAKSYVESTKKNLYNREKWIHRHNIEWHRKFTLSFACLVLFFIGAPLGAIIRKGGLGMPVVISVIFFILYYIISITGEKFVREGIMSAFQGMWLSSGLLLPLGIFLTYKAATDSVILNMDTYIEGFKRIFKWKSKNK